MLKTPQLGFEHLAVGKARRLRVALYAVNHFPFKGSTGRREPTALVVWSLEGICISAFAWKSAKKSAAA